MELLDVGDEGVLKTIKTDHPGDADKCTEKMLQLWLERRSDANWNQLIQALRMRNIRLDTLASELESMLNKGSQ